MLLAISILVLIAGSLGALAKAVQSGSEYGEAHGAASQHARVAMERMVRTISTATASEPFPGVFVVEEYVGAWRFPDTLVVWHPQNGRPRNPDGLPCFDELVLFYPDPKTPNQLLELAIPEGSDTRTVPTTDEVDKQAWRDQLKAIKSDKNLRPVVLTDLLRTGSVSETDKSQQRGAVRFVDRVRPSKDEWDAYQRGDLVWERLSWVQGIFGAKTGLRQAWVRIELQLTPVAMSSRSSTAASGQAIPFFGSATLYYDMHRKAN